MINIYCYRFIQGTVAVLHNLGNTYHHKNIYYNLPFGVIASILFFIESSIIIMITYVGIFFYPRNRGLTFGNQYICIIMIKMSRI